MPALSKLAGSFGLRLLPQNCYEVGHTWTPSCTEATFDIVKSAFVYSFKTYATLYVVRIKISLLDKLLLESVLDNYIVAHERRCIQDQLPPHAC